MQLNFRARMPIFGKKNTNHKIARMSSLAKLVQSGQLYLYKSSKRCRSQNVPLDISQLLNQASKIIVCFPSAPDSMKQALTALMSIKSIFDKGHITVFVDQKNMSPGLVQPNVSVVAFGANDLSKAGKPKRGFLQRNLRATADIVIDLSVPFDFTNVVLSWLCGAALRVGFYHPNREDLYNFLVRSNANVSLDHSYQSLIHYLESF